MDNLARTLRPAVHAEQMAAEVVQARPSKSPEAASPLTVRLDDGRELDARLAPSCLLEPEQRDRVLLAELTDGTAYVLAVLERADAGEEGATVRLPDDATVRVDSGSLRIVAGESIGLVSKTISSVARKLELRGEETTFGASKLVAIIREAVADVPALEVRGQTYNSTFERVTQTARRVLRKVGELDQLRANRVDYTAQKSMHLHGETALVTAKDVVKLDGDQCHIG